MSDVWIGVKRVVASACAVSALVAIPATANASDAVSRPVSLGQVAIRSASSPEPSEPTTTPPPSTTVPPTTVPPTTVPTTPAPPVDSSDDADGGDVVLAGNAVGTLFAEAANTGARGGAVQVGTTLPPPTTTLPTYGLPENSGEGRRVVYSKSQMRVWILDDAGVVVKTHLVSGRRTWNQPKPGTYKVFSRSSYTCNIKSNWICWRYMVRFTVGPEGDNIGFHQIPVNTKTGSPVQSVSQLGRALSGGCVRQAPPDAAWMWDFAYIGTKVVVLG